jgi:hypothetical protein
MATDKSPSPRLGRGLVVAVAEFPTAFRPHTISGQTVQKRRLPGSGRRLDRVDGFLEFFKSCANVRSQPAFLLLISVGSAVLAQNPVTALSASVVEVAYRIAPAVNFWKTIPENRVGKPHINKVARSAMPS